MTVKYFRFISGENVIADLVEEKSNSYIIRDSIVAMPVNEDGTQLGFAPWAPLQDPAVDDIEVSMSHVMYVTQPAPNLVEQYNKMFSRIVAPEKKLIL
ncbi:hypothetical protein Syn7803C97_139 [Synechococcus phage S-MbCM6]|jgi:hypothetical protein|uniref:Uncharacterized protein n=3 Tax=Namakavirus smbcm6 TaxID=2734120 RepID=H8ZMP8_9CAUD|nr:hypothetical protein [Synechococcus phage ACG-2014c]AHB80774.1 hypothetical protein S-MbCM25_139 [Synechococcus phage S-MbCM25]AFD02759.1 hypothetical protein [Synechococcus phage ACG-2014c]AIX14535.1 hypothetical protein Syn7803C43_140 [Synechococcus phage ACG-2014c]AIX22692.1 hypothetical protein Syn7803C97_139 [Synechococcus phage ACG-2014c]AIX22907.1 hypothetical protein Syn7803C98_139 [Synechococcus phage ACG-2014c]